VSLRRCLGPTRVALLGSTLVSGCLGDGGEDAGRAEIEGGRLIVYSSLPRGGPLAGVAEAVAAEQRQAPADAGERAGRYRIRLVELGATTPETDPGEPGILGQ
jgi:hypothetical protein